MRPAVVVFALCAAVCVTGHIAILLSVVRQRSGESGTRAPGVPRPRLAVEVLWALIPALALAFVLTATWDRMRERPPRPDMIMKVAR